MSHESLIINPNGNEPSSSVLDKVTACLPCFSSRRKAGRIVIEEEPSSSSSSSSSSSIQAGETLKQEIRSLELQIQQAQSRISQINLEKENLSRELSNERQKGERLASALRQEQNKATDVSSEVGKLKSLLQESTKNLDLERQQSALFAKQFQEMQEKFAFAKGHIDKLIEAQKVAASSTTTSTTVSDPTETLRLQEQLEREKRALSILQEQLNNERNKNKELLKTVAEQKSELEFANSMSSKLSSATTPTANPSEMSGASTSTEHVSGSDAPPSVSTPGSAVANFRRFRPRPSPISGSAASPAVTPPTSDSPVSAPPASTGTEGFPVNRTAPVPASKLADRLKTFQNQ